MRTRSLDVETETERESDVERGQDSVGDHLLTPAKATSSLRSKETFQFGADAARPLP